MAGYTADSDEKALEKGILEGQKSRLDLQSKMIASLDQLAEEGFILFSLGWEIEGKQVFPWLSDLGWIYSQK